MRIGVLNWTSRQVGGAETYLAKVLPALAARGHELGLVVEIERPADRAPIPLGTGGKLATVEKEGLRGAVEALERFEPDLVFTHITLDPEVEAAVQNVAPAVYFGHAYYGACISGTKTKSFPAPVPCTRPLGPGCLVHFYPRRCGGLNPVTMLSDYRRMRRRQELLAGYDFIVTNSQHMAREYKRNGVPIGKVTALPMPVVEPSPLASSTARPAYRSGGELRLLFAGRMDALKGGMVAIDALPRIAAACAGPVSLTLAGDGPERASLERHAAEVAGRTPGARVSFAGWLSESEMARHFDEAHLLIVPSLWPEPFGLVGPEAGLRGLPAVAFPVGGVPEWLIDGVSGQLAKGPPHDASALAAAVAAAIRDPAHLVALGRGAREVASRFTVEEHVRRLEETFQAISRAAAV